jgi:hypothetical protein
MFRKVNMYGTQLVQIHKNQTMKKLQLLLGLIFITGTAHTQFNQGDYKNKWEYGLEYVIPTSTPNKINTLNANVFFWTTWFKKAVINISFGASAVYAHGYVDQLELHGTDVDEVHVKCKAIGLGPVAQLQFLIARFNKLSIEGEANGAVLLFNHKFPVGGTQYNFMFRTGPNLCWNLDKKHVLKFCYRWQHASNGTGFGPQNPYYEGQGFVAMFTRFI